VISPDDLPFSAPYVIITMARVWISAGHRIRATTGEPLEVNK
jgi:hypothetical protein